MPKDKEYTVKESRIREFAKQCTGNREAMKMLFPEALESKERDITGELEAHIMADKQGGYYFMLDLKVGGLNVLMSDSACEMKNGVLVVRFFPCSESNYKVTTTSDGNFKVVRVTE